MRHLSIKQLEEDKLELEKQLQLASNNIVELQAQVLRMSGALVYVDKSLERLKKNS